MGLRQLAVSNLPQGPTRRRAKPPQGPTRRGTNSPRDYFLKRILLLFIVLLIVDNLNTNSFFY